MFGLVETQKRSMFGENTMTEACDVCGKYYKNAHGVDVHKKRSECGAGMTWGPGRKPNAPVKKRLSERKKVGNNGESGKDAIRRILADQPQGLPVHKITAELEQNGFKIHTNYVSQHAATDPTIVRVERGVYRLKRGLPTQRTGTTVVQEAIAQTKITPLADLPREALVLQIEHLERNARAILDAHMVLLRGVLA